MNWNYYIWKFIFIFASINLLVKSSKHIFPVFGSISIKSTFAPQCNAQFAEETKVLADVQTTSFFPTSNALHAIIRELVALLVKIVCVLHQQNFLNFLQTLKYLVLG